MKRVFFLLSALVSLSAMADEPQLDKCLKVRVMQVRVTESKAIELTLIGDDGKGNPNNGISALSGSKTFELLQTLGAVAMTSGKRLCVYGTMSGDSILAVE